MRNDHLKLAAFASASTTFGSIGAWRNPATDPGILDAEYYINLARSLERSGFDILFFDDRLAMPTAFGNSVAATAKLGSRAVKLDLLTILALVSSHTSRIGLGATYSTTYYAPYHVARAFATLDHLSGGRAVWNIVTSLNINEAENFGVEYQNSEKRYDRADDFLEIVTRLWESWEPDALQIDRSTGIFASPDKVHEVNYQGGHLSSRGPLTVPHTPQGWPVLLQAGQSGRGMQFASRWADLTFTGPRSFELARDHYATQTTLFEAAGRDPRTTGILPAVQIFVGETAEIARAKADFYDSLNSPEEELIVLSEQASFDFSKLPMDEPIDDAILDSIQGTRGLVQRYVDAARKAFGPDATLRDLAEGQGKHSSIRFVGDPGQVADQMSEWFHGRACDGFAIIPTDTPGSFESFGRLVIPELRSRGLMPCDPATEGTLRSRLGLADRVISRHSALN